MTVKAGLTLIDISRYALMRLIHIRLIMFVTINAGEAVVVAPDVTVGAGIPGLMVRTGVNWEI